jgi:hypothetical protein
MEATQPEEAATIRRTLPDVRPAVADKRPPMRSMWQADTQGPQVPVRGFSSETQKLRRSNVAHNEREQLKMSCVEWYVLITTGDGAQCFLVPGEKLKEAVHEELCLCGEPWQECKTEHVKEMVESLDDDDEWTLEYPNYGRYQWRQRFEDGSIEVTRLTDLTYVEFDSVSTV